MEQTMPDHLRRLFDCARVHRDWSLDLDGIYATCPYEDLVTLEGHRRTGVPLPLWERGPPENLNNGSRCETWTTAESKRRDLMWTSHVSGQKTLEGNGRKRLRPIPTKNSFEKRMAGLKVQYGPI